MTAPYPKVGMVKRPSAEGSLQKLVGLPGTRVDQFRRHGGLHSAATVSASVGVIAKIMATLAAGK